MTPSEVAKIKKGINPSSLSTIYGCYIDDSGQIKGRFEQKLDNNTLGEGAVESILKCLRKGISGAMGRNLIEIDVPKDMIGYKVLNKLRDSECNDQDAFSSLMGSITRSDIVDPEKNNGYIVLMAHNVADLSKKGKEDGDGTVGSDEDEGGYVEDGVFRSVVCVAFAVKPDSDGVGFFTGDMKFKSVDYGRLLGSPIVGFMYPSYDKGGAIMEKALYHVQSESNLQPAFISNVFNSKPPATFTDKKEEFGSMMKEALVEDCSVQNIIAVCNEINSRDDEARVQAKESGTRFKPEILTGNDIGMILRNNGADASNVEEFVYQCNSAFDPTDEDDSKKKQKDSPRDFFDTKKIKLEIVTPIGDAVKKIVVTADIDCGEFISTRMVDGKPCVVIEAIDAETRINDLPVNIA